jgi:molecular chaperone GrpE
MTETQHISVTVPDPATSDPAELVKALAAQKDEYLRLAADFDNFKKRTRRDSGQQAAAEKESFVRELLPILDNLERALACEQSTSSAQLRQGVQMTLQQLGRLLSDHGIEATVDIGSPFDPHRHEALSVGHDPRQADHSVLEVIQRGYRCGDKVFRPAKVIVNDWAHAPGGGRAR